MISNPLMTVLILCLLFNACSSGRAGDSESVRVFQTPEMLDNTSDGRGYVMIENTGSAPIGWVKIEIKQLSTGEYIHSVGELKTKPDQEVIYSVEGKTPLMPGERKALAFPLRPLPSSGEKVIRNIKILDHAKTAEGKNGNDFSLFYPSYLIFNKEKKEIDQAIVKQLSSDISGMDEKGFLNSLRGLLHANKTLQSGLVVVSDPMSIAVFIDAMTSAYPSVSEYAQDVILSYVPGKLLISHGRNIKLPPEAITPVYAKILIKGRVANAKLKIGEMVGEGALLYVNAFNAALGSSEAEEMLCKKLRERDEKFGEVAQVLALTGRSGAILYLIEGIDANSRLSDGPKAIAGSDNAKIVQALKSYFPAIIQFQNSETKSWDYEEIVRFVKRQENE